MEVCKFYEEKEANSKELLREAKRQKRRELMEKFAKDRAERRREKRAEAKKSAELGDASWEHSFQKQEAMLKKWMDKSPEERERLKGNVSTPLPVEKTFKTPKKPRVKKRYTPEVMENWRIRWEKQEQNFKVWRSQLHSKNEEKEEKKFEKKP